MRDGHTDRRGLQTLIGVLLLSVIGVPAALAGDLETMRERYGDKLKAHARRIAEIEAKGGGASAGPAMSEWQAGGAERRRLRESITALQRNLARAHTSLAEASEAAAEMGLRVPQSGVLEQVARIEGAAGQARERLGARWELERAARERQQEQRAREAAERARGLR